MTYCPADAIVDRDVDAFVAAVVGDREALEPSTVDQAVADEIHAPRLVDHRRGLQRHTLTHGPLRLAALVDRQISCLVKPVDALVVDPRMLRP